MKIIDKTDALANSILFTVRAVALLLVVALFAGACSERVQRNFNALTTPGPGTPCGAGTSCMAFDNTRTCCGEYTHCSNFGCSADPVPGQIPAEHYWGAARDGGAESSPRYPEH